MRIGAALAVLLLVCACGSQGPQSARIPEPAAEPAPAPREIPLTTTSDAALAEFRQGRELTEVARPFEAKPHFEKAVALDPGFAFAHAQLSRVLTGEEAGAEMERAWQLAQTLSEEEKTFVELWRAELQGDHPRWEKCVTRLEELAPNDWRVQVQLGERHIQRNELAEASKRFRRAVLLNPDAAQAYNLLGFTLVDTGQPEAAVTAMRRYVALRRDDPNPIDSLGEVLLRAGRFEDADAAFSWALRLNPKFWVAATGLAYSHFFRGEWDAGRSVIAAALKNAPNGEARVVLDKLVAWSWLAEGRQGQALAALETAERDAKRENLTASWARMPLLRAQFLLETGQPASALQHLAVAQQRMKSRGLHGQDLNVLRRASLIWRLHAEAQLEKFDAAEKTLAELEADVATSRPGPNEELDHSMKSVIALGRGQFAQVIEHAKFCGPMDYSCQLRKATAQERMGDVQGATVTRAALSGERRRDMVYAGYEPAYLYAYAQVKHPPAIN